MKQRKKRNEFFEGIKAGLEDALAWAEGKEMDAEIEKMLREAVEHFCEKHAGFRAEVVKLPELFEVREDLHVVAFDVCLRWEKGDWRVVSELSRLLNGYPFCVVDDDGAPYPGSFIWTVARRDVVESAGM